MPPLFYTTTTCNLVLSIVSVFIWLHFATILDGVAVIADSDVDDCNSIVIDDCKEEEEEEYDELQPDTYVRYVCDVEEESITQQTFNASLCEMNTLLEELPSPFNCYASLCLSLEGAADAVDVNTDGETERETETNDANSAGSQSDAENEGETEIENNNDVQNGKESSIDDSHQNRESETSPLNEPTLLITLSIVATILVVLCIVIGIFLRCRKTDRADYRRHHVHGDPETDTLII